MYKSMSENRAITDVQTDTLCEQQEILINGTLL